MESIKHVCKLSDDEYIDSAVVEAYTRLMVVEIKKLNFPDILKIITFNTDTINYSIKALTININDQKIEVNAEVDSKSFDAEWKKMYELITSRLFLVPGSSHLKLEYVKDLIK